MGLFQKWSSNSLKVYIFGMWKLKGIISQISFMQIWSHLTFGWPFVNISLTIHPTHSKLYIFVTLTSNLIYMKGHWKHFENLTPLDPCVTPTGKGPNRPNFCQNIIRPITTSKPSITYFHQNGTWVLIPLKSFLSSVQTGCPRALGMESGNIRDDQITASSFHTENGDVLQPWKGRLNNVWGIWATATANPADPWIQVDLLRLTVVTGIITQGRAGPEGSLTSQWIKELQIQYGHSEDTLMFISENKIPKVSTLAHV